jgi:sigma-B regulation protein RsbU (phosphoserine phosphatase)
MKLKTRLLVQTLSAALAFTLVLSLMFFLAVAAIRNTVLANSGELGNSAAELGASALEEQVTDKIARIAQDMALILDEKLLKIENHTRMTADIAGAIYTRREAYRPYPLPYVSPGRMTPAEPYIHAAPGVNLERIRGEAELAGNIADVLRQITVVDRGITTSTIGGESGYIIAMDAFPWPQAEFDPRRYSWYHGAQERGGLYWTGVYSDMRGRGPVISCSMPFYDQSESGLINREEGGSPRIFRGVARSTVLLSDFSKLIDSIRVGRTGYLFLLDRTGLKLFSSGSVDLREAEGGGISGENFLKSDNPRLRSLGLSMTLGASGMTELEVDGVAVYVAYAPIHTLGWSLGVAIPFQEIAVPAWQIEERIQNLTGRATGGMDRRILLLTGLVGLMLLAGLGALAVFSVRFTESVTGPILALSEGVREVSGGNLDRLVSVKTGDELEQLACSFNTMTGRLREHIAEIARATAEQQRIATELDVATQIQTSMLPTDFPPFPARKNDFELFATVHPAKEVGGDFYDFFFIDPDHFTVVVADVSGKGVPAALFMAITKTLIRNHIRSGEAPELAMTTINRQLCDNNIANMFVTLWLGTLEISSGRLAYINAGHNPPLVKRSSEPVQNSTLQARSNRRFAEPENRDFCGLLTAKIHNLNRPSGASFEFLRSPPDLVLAGMDDTVYRRQETVLAAGDTLFLYTDGITEAADAGGRFYGAEGLRRFLDSQGDLSPRELLARLRADIARYTAGVEQSDDITMLALRFVPEQGASRSIRLRAEPERLAELLAFINGELEPAGCPVKIRGQIELAAEEIFVNIARYAYKNHPGPPAGEETPGEAFPCGIFEVAVDCGLTRTPAGTTMTLAFTDRGEPFNPLERADPDITLPLEEREVGGLGVLIVKRTMDAINYNYVEGVNRLVITKSW